MTANQAIFIATSWLIVIAAFLAIYLTERGVLCSLAMVVLSIGVVVAVVSTVLSDGNRETLQAE